MGVLGGVVLCVGRGIGRFKLERNRGTRPDRARLEGGECLRLSMRTLGGGLRWTYLGDPMYSISSLESQSYCDDCIKSIRLISFSMELRHSPILPLANNMDL
jgi:hypothetical protein